MNVQQFRALLEIRRTGSVTRAAEALGVSQPNLSRSVKELEKELGVILFRRGSKGMEPTAEAAQIMRYAKSIVNQMDELESMYAGHPDSLHFCLAAPHANYITKGLAEFLSQQHRKLDVRYLELPAQTAMETLVRGESQLAIVRYQNIYDEYFREVFAQSSFAWRVLIRYEAVVVMSKHHPLANEIMLDPEQLIGYTQLMEGEVQLPVNYEGEAIRNSIEPGLSRIYVQDRASQLILLKELSGSYMWSMPMNPTELIRKDLVQKKCSGGINKDVVLWRSRPGLGPTARDCLVALQAAARRQSRV